MLLLFLFVDNALYDVSSVLGCNLRYIEHSFSCSLVNLNDKAMYLQKLALSDSSRNSLNLYVIKELC